MNNLIPIHKFSEVKQLIDLGYHVQKIDHNKHNSNKIVFFFEGNENFFRDWNYIKNK